MDPVVRVQELIEPVLASEGIELFDVEYKTGLLRVLVDRDGGIDLEAVGAVTRQVSELLDHHDVIPGGTYTLEVSSPGVERPLRTPRHFQRHVGRTITLRTHPQVEGERRVEGVLEMADETGITVAGRTLTYGDIERARTVFEWGPAPKPGSAPKRTKKRATTS